MPTPRTAASTGAGSSSRPSQSSGTTSAAARLRRQYQLHRFTNLDEQADTILTLPEHIKVFSDMLQADRAEVGLPKADVIVGTSKYTRNQKEVDAMINLEEYIGHVPQCCRGGEEHIDRVHGQLWRQDCLPANSDADFERALKAYGLPATPKPDIFYGYLRNTFTSQEQELVMKLELPVAPHNEPGAWFPYLIIEWKSEITGGTSAEGANQVIRDGAAAVQSMHAVYEAARVPNYAGSVIVSAVVISRMIDWRIHWRQKIDSNVYFCTKIFDTGLLDKDADMLMTRRISKNLLDWVNGDRLNEIKTVAAVPGRIANPQSPHHRLPSQMSSVSRALDHAPSNKRRRTEQ